MVFDNFRKRVLRAKLNIFIIFFVLVFPLGAFAWTGKCVGVSDGDTISVMHEGKAEKIRLYGIDCPEKGQPFGTRAKQFTGNMVFGKIVAVKPTTIDKYGRTVAWVYLDNACLNKKLLEAGLAWHYKQYSSDEDLALFEIDARTKKIGLWADSKPIPPWDWRHRARSSTVTDEQSPRSPPSSVLLISPSVTSKPAEIISYHGNIQSHIFHGPGCRYYNCKNCTAVFNSREEGIKAGYRPCKVCNP